MCLFHTSYVEFLTLPPEGILHRSCMVFCTRHLYISNQCSHKGFEVKYVFLTIEEVVATKRAAVIQKIILTKTLSISEPPPPISGSSDLSSFNKTPTQAHGATINPSKRIPPQIRNILLSVTFN